MQEIISKKTQYNINKLNKRLRRLVGTAIADFNMIEPGDRVMVCLSGGKDSYGLLDILLNLQAHAPLDFDLVAVNLDQKQPGFPEHVLPEYLTRIGVPFRIVEQDTYSVVKRVIAEEKRLVVYVLVCGEEFCIVSQKSLGQLRLRWVIIGTIFLKRFSSICFMEVNLRQCLQN